MVRSTLCYIENDGKYLMLYRNKKANDMNEGKWIGLGGKIEPGESPDDCVIREVREESGLELTAVNARGLVHFIDDSGYAEDMYLYTAEVSTGATVDEDLFELQACDEGELRWIDKDKMFDLSLWEGDKHFLKKLIDSESDFEMTLEYKDNKCTNVTSCKWNRG